MVDFVNWDGEVMSIDEVEHSYTREGRRAVGKEYPNPVPMEPPIGFVPSKPIWEQIREMVKTELSQGADREGFETAEEADDFDVGDDYDPSSPYEDEFEPSLPWPPSKNVEAAEAEVAQARETVLRLKAELAEAEKIAGPPEGGPGGEAPPAPSQ